MRKAYFSAIGVAGVAAAAILAVTFSAGAREARTDGGWTTPTAVPQSMAQVQLTFAPVVRKVAPAVVNVYAQRRVKQRRGRAMMDDPFFQRFFGGPNGRREGRQRERVQKSLGSGVMVRSDGIIVTNNHVIDGGEEFKIVMADRREYDAEVLLTDERTDLAVLRIDTKGERMPIVGFRDSDEIAVGDLVLALGNPFGVGQTVTSGIVSAVARTQVGISDLNFFIQTDAAINPGNSGGALVTTDGKLSGINTAIFSRSGGSNGIGFAIPANMVRRVVDSAVAGKKLVRPWLGAGYQKVTSELAQSLGLDRPGGALISDVYPRSPASRAGLRSGDVIRKVDGFDVADPQGLRYRVATKKTGESVSLQYQRNGRLHSASVRVLPPPEDPPRNETKIQIESPLSGATVANLSPAFNEENGVDPMLRGVAISKTTRGSLASRARFRSGDIIIAVNDRKVERVRDLQRELDRAGRSWIIEVNRGGRIFERRYRW
jgi:serine protease Do